MPRPLLEYSVPDVLRLQPVKDYSQWAGTRLRMAQYVRQRNIRRNENEIASALTGKRVLITVAFNHPEVIELQARLVRQLLPGPLHLITDNSSDEAKSMKIREVAAAAGLPYVRLPSNPWTFANDSHGAALNWTWRNIVKPGRPEAFGFLDHDIFPSDRTDPFTALARYPIAGRVRTSNSAEHRWYLWPGFCFFDFAAVKHRRLDFDLDRSSHMDTGGYNWWRLYRYLDRQSVPDAGCREERTQLSETCSVKIQVIGTWLHRHSYGHFISPDDDTRNKWFFDQLRARCGLDRIQL